MLRSLGSDLMLNSKDELDSVQKRPVSDCYRDPDPRLGIGSVLLSKYLGKIFLVP